MNSARLLFAIVREALLLIAVAIRHPRAAWRFLRALWTCRREGHAEVCEVAVDKASLMETHRHLCLFCGTITRDETAPVSDDVRALLAEAGISLDPGLTPAQQSGYMN